MCSKVRDLGATPEAVFEALYGSHLEQKLFCTCDPCTKKGDHLYVRRRQPLPPFVGQHHKSNCGLVVDAPAGAVDAYHTMGRFKDQRTVQETLGLKEIGDLTTVFREVIGECILGPVVANGYERVVYGDHGPYIEFTHDQINWDAWPHFHDKSSFGAHRCYDEHYTAHSFPIWQQRWEDAKKNTAPGSAPRPNADGLLMLYEQTQRVDHRPFAPGAWTPGRQTGTGYADYQEGCFYMTASCKLIAVEGRNVKNYTEGYSADRAVLSVFKESNVAPATTSLCWQWQEGRCWKGDACKWSHGEPVLEQRTKLSAASPSWQARGSGWAAPGAWSADATSCQ